MRKRRLVVRILRHARPRLLGRRAHDVEDAVQLVGVGRAGKQRASRVHFRNDAPGRPDVNGRIVRPAAQQHVGRPVPQRHNLVGKGVDRNAHCPGQAKVPELQDALLVDEEILGLQVPVQNAVLVAVGDATQHLIRKPLDHGRLEAEALPGFGPLARLPFLIHVLFQIVIHVIKDHHQLVLRMNDIAQAQDVFV